MKPTRNQILTLTLAITLLAAGCPQNITIDLPGDDSLTIPLPGATIVRVEVFNDTNYEIAPRILYDDDTGFWERLVSSSSELTTGFVQPGELVRFNIDCEQLGVIYSDSAGQFWGPDTIGQAGTTRLLEKNDHFDCGDTIQFQYIGDGDGFGVIVSINDAVVTSS